MTKKCEKCECNKDVEEFAIDGFDQGTEEFSRSSLCAECVTIDDSEEDIDDIEEEYVDEEDEESEEDFHERLTWALLSRTQMDRKILSSYDRDTFISKIGPTKNFSFDLIKKLAAEKLEQVLGLHYDRERTLKPGNYIIIGDSHGVYTEKGIVKCINRLAKDIDAQGVIHVGHILDNHHNIGNSLSSLKNLTVIAMENEIYHLSKNSNLDIVREKIIIGDILVRNQSFRSDYTHGSSSSINLNEYGYSTIIYNRHLHELHTICKNDETVQLVTPGCICERHRARKPRKNVPKDFNEVHEVAIGFTYTGQRQNELNRFWENGITIVSVDKSGTSTIVMCRAKKLGNDEFAIAYGNSIYTESDIVVPDEIGFVTGDTHVSNHDPKALDIADQVVQMISPDYFINLGDHWNFASLNHHALDRNEPITDEEVANECGKGVYILEKMAAWAKKKFAIIGNHERFVDDFTKKHPQLSGILNYQALCGARQLGYDVKNLKGVINYNDVKFVHGDIRMYGSRGGDKHSKLREVMESEVMYGHVHRPVVRCGVYAIGLMGDLDQGYNEVEASNWMHGVGVVYHYQGVSFMTSIGFKDYRMLFMGKSLKPRRKKMEKWMAPEFKAEIIYRQC